MDGILEQILSELKEIKQLLAENKGMNLSDKGGSISDTLTVKEAAAYLGIAEYRIRTLTQQGIIRHVKAGRKYLYKRKALDLWLEETQEDSIRKKDETLGYGRIRKIKE